MLTPLRTTVTYIQLKIYNIVSVTQYTSKYHMHAHFIVPQFRNIARLAAQNQFLIQSRSLKCSSKTRPQAPRRRGSCSLYRDRDFCRAISASCIPSARKLFCRDQAELATVGENIRQDDASFIFLLSQANQ